MLTAYLGCALWSSSDCDDNPLDDLWSISDFSQEALLSAQTDIENFLVLATPYIDKNVGSDQIGHDFWLGRNRHGSSFFDRPEIYGEKNADKLTELSQIFGEKYIYVQNDLLEFE